MPDAPQRHDPLAGRGGGYRGDGVALVELPFAPRINLRGRGDEPAFRDAVRSALGVGLPEAPNTVAEGEGRRVVWLGPDEWLVTGDGDTGEAIASGLGAALGGLPHSLVDVSEAAVTIRIEGPNALRVLRKGCGLDLHPRAFKPGACAQTGLAKASVLLHCSGDGPRFDIHVDRSFADYLWRWLEDAALEFRSRS